MKLKKWIISTSSKRRRFFMLLKVSTVIIMFGLYVFFLMQESMSVIEKGRLLTGASSSNNIQHRQRAKIKLTRHYNRPTGRPINKQPNVNHNNNEALKSSKKANNNNNINNKNHTNVSTLNPIYEYSEEVNAIAEKDFQQRRHDLHDGCDKWKLFDKYPPNAWEFFISPGHSLAYCPVFKAASSTWLYYFNVLAGYNLPYLQKTKAPPLELARKRFPRPSPNELSEALSSSVSFLISREPFERLVSAYRNKLEGCRNKFYKLLGEQIVKKFRQPSVKKMKKKKSNKSKKSGPSFKEFLEFLVHHHSTGGRFDEHWSPIYTFCTPCSINFTIIAKTETFQRDTEYIIRQAGLDILLLDKMPKKKTNLKRISNRSSSDTKSLVAKYFSQIDEQLLNKVLEIYGPDFDLFGYDPTKYFDLVQQVTTKAVSTSKNTTTNKLSINKPSSFADEEK